MSAATVSSRRYARWEDAMIAQSRLLDWSWSDRGLRYLTGFYRDMNSRTKEGTERDVRVLAAIQVRSLHEGEPIYVSWDMCELVNHARETFTPEPVRPNDPFVPCGFALLAQPLMLKDAPRTVTRPNSSPVGVLPIRAIAWMAVHDEDIERGCFWIHYYTDINDEFDTGERVGERWTPNEVAYLRSHCPLLLSHTFQWSWGTNPWTDPTSLHATEDEPPEVTAERGKQQAALVQTLWRIGAQISPGRWRAPRQVRRDAKRKRLERDDVTVMVLRRTSGEPREESSGRHYSVRSLVRGYWARRHFKDGTRQVWVRPYIRGDESLPFKETTRAWEFRR